MRDPSRPPGGGNADGARAERFVVCHNPDAADRDAAVRERLIEHLSGLIEGSDAWTARRRDELVGSLKSKPGLRRYLRRTTSGLLRTSDATLTPEDLAAAYKQLLQVERGWRDMKGALGPEFRRSRAHTGLINWIVAGQGPEGSLGGDFV